MHTYVTTYLIEKLLGSVAETLTIGRFMILSPEYHIQTVSNC